MKKRTFIIITIIAILICSQSFAVSAEFDKPLNADDYLQAIPEEEKTNQVVRMNTKTGEITFESVDSELFSEEMRRTISELNSKSATSKSAISKSGDITLSSDAYSPMANKSEKSPSDKQNQIKTVFGTDGRQVVSNTNAEPFNKVCMIYYMKNNVWVSRGSASLIGPNTVITNAHCVYNQGANEWCDYAKVVFGHGNDTDGNNSNVGIESTIITISSEFYYGIGDGWRHDWAIVELDDAVGNYRGWFGKSWTSGSLTGLPVTLTGFPGKVFDYNTVNNWRPTFQMYTQSGNIINGDSSSDNVICFNLDATRGNSGSPLYNNSHQIVGLFNWVCNEENEYENGYFEWVSGQAGYNRYNSGVRLTSGLYSLLEQYRPASINTANKIYGLKNVASGKMLDVSEGIDARVLKASISMVTPISPMIHLYALV